MAATAAAAAAAVRLELLVVSEESVSVQLLPSASAEAADMEAEAEDDSSYASSSDSDSEGDAAEGAEDDDEPLDVIENYADLKKMIAYMDADEDGAGGGGEAGGAGDASHRAETELFGSLPPPSLAELGISAEEPLTAAGSVQTMLEGMIVIKASGQAGGQAGQPCGHSAWSCDCAVLVAAASAAAVLLLCVRQQADLSTLPSHCLLAACRRRAAAGR